MSELTIALGIAAPYFNLVLVLVSIYLFLKLFYTRAANKDVKLLPWKLIFFALLVFVVEEIITVLRTLGVINIPMHINGFFELAIITIFIYTLLLQKQYIKQARTQAKTPATPSVKKKK